MKNITTIRKAVATLANQLKATKLTQSERWSWAWFVIREEMEDCIIIKFLRKSGEATKRVVTKNFAKFNPIKGTGRKSPEGLNLFADVAKIAANMITGKNRSSVISCYEYEIV